MTAAEMRVAIVGGSTLKGRELADLLKERNFPSRDVRLLDDEESLGQLEAIGDEVTFIQAATRDQFERVDIAFFASSEKYTRTTWQIARDAGCALVDLSYGLESQTSAAVQSPWVERELGLPVKLELQPGPVILAHPAAVALALLILRAQNAGVVRNAVATVIEPASEHGRKGLDELHEQTINLLSFKELPKQVFDEQVAFNLLARYGQASQASLDLVQQRISRHVARITDGHIPLPSLLVLQGPSFHSHALSVHLEMETEVDFNEFAKALIGEHVQVTVASAEDSPTNVSAAGQDEILVAVRPDAQHANGVWLWVTADNLRVLALNALDCAERIAAARPKGKIQ